MTTAPRWLDNAIFYEIYPQSFQDSNGDGIGDLQGIISRLDYILDLGCNAIWINPCYVSPFLDAGYDVADYCRIAPRYGTNEDARQLFAEAHKRGMHVLLDLVPGHTSWEHPWFKASMKAARNEFTDRYVWTNDIWESPDGSDPLRGISERNGCCAVNFFTHQPALNYGYYKPEKPWQQPMDAPGPMATREAMKAVMRFWLDMGCDGFRVDMAASLVKGDPDHEGTIALWQDMFAFLGAEYPEAAMVSEWSDPARSLRGGFHMDFTLGWTDSHYDDLFRCEKPYFAGEGDASAFVATYMKNLELSGGKGLICVPSGNHDVDRLARSIRGPRLPLAFAFLLSLPCAPFIYYGDEIGMRYVEGLPSLEGGYNRTGSRTPMQWDAGRSAGFSSADPDALYLPLDPDPCRPTVAAQRLDEGSLWHTVRRLIGFRKAHPALQNRGEIRFLRDGAPGQPLVYLRRAGGETILAAVNPFGAAHPLPEAPADSVLLRAIGQAAECREGQWILPPVSAAFLQIKN